MSTTAQQDTLIATLAAVGKRASQMPQVAPTSAGTLALVAASKTIHQSMPAGTQRDLATWIIDRVKFTTSVRGAVAASPNPDATATELLGYALDVVGINA